MKDDKNIRLLAFLKSDNLAEAKQAYAFIQGEELKDNAKSRGVYLIYEDGHAELYSGNKQYTGSVRAVTAF